MYDVATFCMHTILKVLWNFKGNSWTKRTKERKENKKEKCVVCFKMIIQVKILHVFMVKLHKPRKDLIISIYSVECHV